MNRALSEERVARIRCALRGEQPRGGPTIDYRVPWTETDVIERGAIDMVFSQAVLEHVDDLRGTYEAMAAWLKPDGLISHQIDLRSHGFAHEWNGHWKYSWRSWMRLRRGRPWTINRATASWHADEAARAGFNVVREMRFRNSPGISRAALADRFAGMSNDDLATSGVFLQAWKLRWPTVDVSAKLRARLNPGIGR